MQLLQSARSVIGSVLNPCQSIKLLARKYAKRVLMNDPAFWKQILPLHIAEYTVEHWKRQVEGDLNSPLVFHRRLRFANDITNEGKNDILDVYFSDGTQTASGNWRIGLVNASGFTAFAATDTLASHGGWTELTTYSQGTRPAWGPGNPATQSITNAAAVQFDMTGTATVQGIFIPNDSTKGGTTGILWSTAPFSPTVPVVNGDQLRVTYTLSC